MGVIRLHELYRTCWTWKWILGLKSYVHVSKALPIDTTCMHACTHTWPPPTRQVRRDRDRERRRSRIEPAPQRPQLRRAVLYVSGEGRIRATWGWISVDRGSKATLPLTMPRRVFKSSAKDSARRPCEIDLRGGRPRLVRRGGLADGTGPSGPEPLLWVGRDGGRWRRLLAWILT